MKDTYTLEGVLYGKVWVYALGTKEPIAPTTDRAVEHIGCAGLRFEQGKFGGVAHAIDGRAARAADVVDGDVARGGEEKGPHVPQPLRIGDAQQARVGLLHEVVVVGQAGKPPREERA